MKHFFLILLFGLMFSISYAQVVITEIMYDTQGSDSGREWIEIYNNNSEGIDVVDWWFYDGSNHGFQNESAVLAGNSYAVIVDNPIKFSADNPGLNTLILDSSAFSLKNTGEYISVRDNDKADVDGLTYAPIESANGNGNSLQKINGAWISAAPTPGLENEMSQSEESNESEEVSNNSDPSNASVAPIFSLSISADAGGNRNVIVGADTMFYGLGIGTAGEPLQSARYSWNLGDGTIKEGKTISHVYKYPGVYAVVLNVSSGKYTSADRISVKAEPADVFISNIQTGEDGFIELNNESGKELDLSFWHLRVDGLHFTFPEDTYIFSNTKLIFPYTSSDLLVRDGSSILLLYPNSKTVDVYAEPSPRGTLGEGGEKTPKNKEITNPRVPLGQEESDVKEVIIDTKLTEIQAAVGNVGIPKPARALLAGRQTPLYQWLLVLSAVTFLAIGSVIYVRRKELTPTVKLAKQIKIIED